MQYTVSMTTRMLAIAGLCVFLLCVLLFLLGIELGKRFAAEQPLPPATATMSAPAMPALPQAPAAPSVTAPSVTAPSVTAPAISKP